MEKQFVTYEIANILKDKGFNEPCFRYYRITPFSKGEQVLCYSDSWVKSAREVRNRNLGTKLTAALLWQQVIDWLADKYKIEFSLTVGYEDGIYEDEVKDREYRSFNILILEGGPSEPPSDVLFFEEHIYGKTRREIINEFCIPKALKLIC